MRGKSKILLLLVLVIAALGIAGLALLVPFSASSEVSPYEYRVNTLRANWYLLANGYRHKYGGVRITLTGEAQSGYRHTGKGDMVFQSVSAVTEGDTLEMRVQYDPVQIANYESGRVNGSYTRDLYMYLCLAMQGDNPEVAECYARADEQIARERWLPGEAARVVRAGETGWRLVGRAHAQSCAGMIQCGGITTAGYCSTNSNKSCTKDEQCDPGTCIGGGQSRCDTSLNPINCNTLTDQNSCQTDGYVRNCNIGCNTSAENFCSWGGSGGGSCPGECRQGSACGVGYSGASGCSGQGPGGGCKTNQVCCSANSCGGGGGGGSVACVAPQDCPPGTVKSATVKSAVCQPVCGNNAWGTGGTPGTAQSYTGCCQWETTGGGNCVWEPCPTKSNPNKVCKVCDPEETWCKKETVTTYECIPSCTTQNPSAVTLVTPADGANVGGTGVTLDWTGVSSWGVACDSARQYEVFVDTVPTPTTIYGVVGEGVTSDYFMGSIGQTYYWKIRAHNGSVYTDSPVRSFTLVANQITGTV